MIARGYEGTFLEICPSHILQRCIDICSIFRLLVFFENIVFFVSLYHKYSNKRACLSLDWRNVSACSWRSMPVHEGLCWGCQGARLCRHGTQEEDIVINVNSEYNGNIFVLHTARTWSRTRTMCERGSLVRLFIRHVSDTTPFPLLFVHTPSICFQ